MTKIKAKVIVLGRLAKVELEQVTCKCIFTGDTKNISKKDLHFHNYL